MGLFRKMADFFVARFAPVGPQGFEPVGIASDAGERVSASSALALSAVWACRALIAGTISSMPLTVYRTRNGERQEDRGHPLWRVLHDSPNYDQTALDFWDYVASAVELWGNGYARVIRDRGTVIGLAPVHPELVVPRRLPDGAIEYRWSEDGKSYALTDKDMLHIRGPGGNPLGGMSTLAFGRNTFGLARAADRAASGMFVNGLRPSGTLNFPEWLTAEQRATANDILAAKYQGAINSGKPMILEGGVEWKQLTISPEDAQMLESRAFSVEEICRFFGVPPFMIGHTEKTTSWGTGLQEQVLGFQKFTLRSRLKRIEQAITKQLLTPGDRANGVMVEFNLEGLLRADSAGRASFYQSALANGWMTINEVRRLENMPAVPGGDEPRMQMQNVPLTGAQEAITP